MDEINTTRSTQTKSCWEVLDSRPFYLKHIDVNALTSTWPYRFSKQTSIHIEVFSDEDVMLEALERCDVKTGYCIDQDSGTILGFNTIFRGWQIADRLTIRDKYVGVQAEQELTIQVTNYGNESVFLRKGTPLGHLIISANC